ncbi:MAG: MCP four helix bundle domain-containing protein [Verrucomicrobia bacterium]|nr:MCP four helix bundle domain-containing protein [Verrucomicrobiota bacterium]MBI3867681.1 MCP four helix bundle domain-containing protein [Verrucomicrobiota bacterium]
MRSWTIGKQLGAGFLAIAILVAVLTFLTLHELNTIREAQLSLGSKHLPALTSAAKLRAYASEIQMAVLRHLTSATPEERRSCDETIAALTQKAEAEIAALESNVLAPETKARLQDAAAAQADSVKARGPLLELSSAGKREEAFRMRREVAGPAFSAYSSALTAMFDHCIASAAQAAQSSDQAVTRTRRILNSVAGPGCALLLVVAGVIIRSLKRRLRAISGELSDGGKQVSAAAAQVASTSQSLASGASHQAASLEETSASLQEMTAMVRRNAEAAHRAKALANETRGFADSGVADMREMQAAMTEIHSSSAEVTKIVKDIDEIAFQTNILALNAAVEAARAGEAGAGFAVVADEVRNLAQRSAMAAKETAAKIEMAIQKSDRGVGISEKVASSLQQIVAKVREVDGLVAEIADASKEQAQGVDEVNRAVNEMDKLTQNNAASAEEAASAAEELSAQAGCVRDSARDLESLVTGAASETFAPASPASQNAKDDRLEASRHRSTPAASREARWISMEGDNREPRAEPRKADATTREDARSF